MHRFHGDSFKFYMLKQIKHINMSNGALSYDANKGVSWIDYDKLGNPVRVQFTDHSITEHVYAADGRKKEPHPNPLPCFEVIL